MSVRQLEEALVAVIIALANEKGGVGKTTLTALFMAILAMLGYDVLGIDMDPQGHLGLCFAHPRSTIDESIYDILWKYTSKELRAQKPIKRLILPTYYDVSTGKIFDPREPHGDPLEVAQRKVSAQLLETIVREATGGLLEGVLEVNNQNFYATQTWYTFQSRIAEALANQSEDEEPLSMEALVPEITLNIYSAREWESTQQRIDAAMGNALKERLNAETTKRGPDLIAINADAGEADFVLKGKHQYWGDQLRHALAPIVGQYHYIFIDCPPSIQTLTINALNASDFVAIPLSPETLNLEGMVGLLNVIGQAQAKGNPKLQTAGVILNKMQASWKVHQESAAAIRDWPVVKNVLPTEIRQNAPVVSSLDNQSLIVLDQPESEYARSYWYLLNDLLQIVGGPAKEDMAEVVASMREQDQKRREEAERKKQERLAHKAEAARIQQK